MVTMCTRAIQDMLVLTNTVAKPVLEATTSTRGKLRPMPSQDMVTDTAVDMLGPLLMLHQPPMAILPMDTAMDTGAATTIRNSSWLYLFKKRYQQQVLPTPIFTVHMKCPFFHTKARSSLKNDRLVHVQSNSCNKTLVNHDLKMYEI